MQLMSPCLLLCRTPHGLGIDPEWGACTHLHCSGLSIWSKHCPVHPGGCALDLSVYTEVITGRRINFLYPYNSLRNRALMMVETEVGSLIFGRYGSQGCSGAI
jgi:hypothetical protein